MSARQMLPFVLQMWKLKPKIMQPAHSTIEANPSLRVPGRLDKQRRWWWGALGWRSGELHGLPRFISLACTISGVQHTGDPQ